MAWMVSDYPEPDFEKEPQCPVCGEVCEKIYIGRLNNEVYGCDQCIRCIYAEELDGE